MQRCNDAQCDTFRSSIMYNMFAIKTLRALGVSELAPSLDGHGSVFFCTRTLTVLRLYFNQKLTFVRRLQKLYLCSRRIHSSLALGCLWCAFPLFTLSLVTLDVGGVFRISV